MSARATAITSFLGTVAVGVGAGIAVAVWHHDGRVPLDHALSAALGRDSVLHPVARTLELHAGWLADGGSARTVAVLSAAVVLVAISCRDARTALYCLITLPSVAAVVELLLKPLVHRTRYGFISYPSMHAAGVAALAVVVVVVVARRFRSRAVRLIAAAAAATVTLVVCGGVIYRGFHEVTDVVGGAAIGAGMALLLAVAVFRSRYRASR